LISRGWKGKEMVISGKRGAAGKIEFIGKFRRRRKGSPTGTLGPIGVNQWRSKETDTNVRLAGQKASRNLK